MAGKTSVCASLDSGGGICYTEPETASSKCVICQPSPRKIAAKRRFLQSFKKKIKGERQRPSPAISPRRKTPPDRGYPPIMIVGKNLKDRFRHRVRCTHRVIIVIFRDWMLWRAKCKNDCAVYHDKYYSHRKSRNNVPLLSIPPGWSYSIIIYKKCQYIFSKTVKSVRIYFIYPHKWVFLRKMMAVHMAPHDNIFSSVPYNLKEPSGKVRDRRGICFFARWSICFYPKWAIKRSF